MTDSRDLRRYHRHYSPIHRASSFLAALILIPCLTGKESSAPHDAIFLRKYDQQRFAVRRGKHKLVIPAEGQAAELYNLAEDIGETRDLRAAHPEKAAELEALLKAWDEELIPPRFLGLIHLEENIKKWGRPKRW